MIIGCGGSGKSTLAKKIHQITGLPLIHMDQQYWQPNWVEPDKLDWEKKVEQQSDASEWIMDGNYGGTMDMRLKKAEGIIFLDRSKWLCLYRVLKRKLQYLGKTRPDMTEGCIERVTWEFFAYVYNYNQTRRPKILEKLKDYQSSKKVYILQNQKQVLQFLNNLKSNYG